MDFFDDIVNTCNVCGTPLEGVYAHNRDDARAGLGVCEEHSKIVIPDLGNVNQVIGLVEQGYLSVNDAIRIEESGAQRSTLLNRLKDIQAAQQTEVAESEGNE